jgi:hypothetical protein
LFSGGISQQLVDQIKNGSIPGENVILQQVVAQIGEDGIFKENEITPQLVAQIAPPQTHRKESKGWGQPKHLHPRRLKRLSRR